MNTQPPILLTGQPLERDDDCACPDKAFLLVFDQVQSDALDHDCACPDGVMGLTAVSTLLPTPTFTQTSAHSQRLPNNHYLVFIPYVPGGPSVLNQAAWERWQAFATPQPGNQAIDAELAQQMLIQPNGRSPQPLPGQPQTLTVWLHITNACDLDCPFCYVRKSSARMSESTGLQAVESIFRTAQQHGFKRVKLKYAGGEATLHFKLVRRLHQRAVELAAETGLALKEVVLSNGVHLRPADAAWLAANGVKLMISLDGVGELHNQLRPLSNHAPYDTFTHVQHTIDEVLLPLGIKPDITMTVTAVNAHGAADLAKWALVDRDLPTSFNFYRQNLLSASRADLDLEEKALIEGMLAAYAVIEEHLPERPFLNGLLDRVQAEAHTHTCGVGQSYLVITHEGRLAQCQMHLEQPVSNALNADLLLPVAAGPLRNLSVDDKAGCRECEFRYRCSGGCPLETYRVNGRWDVQSPNCRIYKTLYPAALRLEGLRLLKTHGYLH
ncbi:MAG: SPASM domain-containing protein [Chloroflexi bacterium]|nr:SPASM domain-containing protein [Chloroflexota bacterium]